MRKPVRTRNLLFVFLLFATLGGYWIVQAGSLDPSGPPTSTMKPLSELSSA